MVVEARHMRVSLQFRQKSGALLVKLDYFSRRSGFFENVRIGKTRKDSDARDATVTAIVLAMTWL
jgi:hypothetical protein